MRALYDLPAPAKLNLFLHVVGRRDDGYHLLQSVFALIDWCDTLHVERRDDGRLRRHDLGAPLPEDDLCLRAARLLQSESGCTLGADLSIDKQVPWGAGLGGGSSDAATTLLALNRLWGLRWPRERLLVLALRLGADVPFFVGGRNAWVEGIGERLTPIELVPRWYAVLKPAAAVPTSAIYGSPLLGRDTSPATIFDFSANPKGFGRNDMQAPAGAYSSEVAEALAMLEARYGASRMTGSGSAVFAEAGPGDAPEPAMKVASALPAGWVQRMCRGLARHPLARDHLLPGSSLLLFSDGLVEDRSRSLDEGLDALASVFSKGEVATAEEACALAQGVLVEGSARADDVCLLAVRVD